MATMLAQRQTAFAGTRVAQKAPVLAAARSRQAVQTQALFGFGASKAPAGAGAATKQYMICIDCGYIYDGAQDFKALPSSYKCPVCSSPKSRFKVYKGSDVKGNAPAVMKKRKESKQW